METGTVNNTQCLAATMALMEARAKLRTGVKYRTIAHPLLDHLLEALKLKNDAALARLLDVQPPVLSKIRHGVCKFSASMAILAHEATGLSFDEMRAMLGMTKGEKFSVKPTRGEP